jgi:glycine cleavage system transcriptional repressor
MTHWYMLTLVGKDQVGIVAKVTSALYQAGCNLGEASMLRLGGNFTIMLMVNYSGTAEQLDTLLQSVKTHLTLQIHIMPIEEHQHQHHDPEVRITVHGADRAGIVAEVTTALSGAGLNILDLESDVGGSTEHPFYIMQIEGTATQGIDALSQALQTLLETHHPNLKVQLDPIETLVM